MSLHGPAVAFFSHLHRTRLFDPFTTVDLVNEALPSLITTVKEYDDEFSNDVELSWRMVFSPAITYLSYKHAASN